MPERLIGNKLGRLIMIFIFLIVGVIMIGIIADSINENTEISNMNNESIAITSTQLTITDEPITIASGVGVTNSGPNVSVVSVTFFGNNSVNTSSAGIIVGQQVNFTLAGDIMLDQVNFTDGKYNITYVFTRDATGQTANADVTSVTYFGNGSINTDDSALAVDAQVNWTSAGVITVNSRNWTDATYDIDYTFEGTNYVKNTTTHSLLNLIVIFFAISIMLTAFFIVMEVQKEFSSQFK